MIISEHCKQISFHLQYVRYMPSTSQSPFPPALPCSQRSTESSEAIHIHLYATVKSRLLNTTAKHIRHRHSVTPMPFRASFRSSNLLCFATIVTLSDAYHRTESSLRSHSHRYCIIHRNSFFGSSVGIAVVPQFPLKLLMLECGVQSPHKPTRVRAREYPVLRSPPLPKPEVRSYAWVTLKIIVIVTGQPAGNNHYHAKGSAVRGNEYPAINTPSFSHTKIIIC